MAIFQVREISLSSRVLLFGAREIQEENSLDENIGMQLDVATSMLNPCSRLYSPHSLTGLVTVTPRVCSTCWDVNSVWWWIPSYGSDEVAFSIRPRRFLHVLLGHRGRGIDEALRPTLCWSNPSISLTTSIQLSEVHKEGDNRIILSRWGLVNWSWMLGEVLPRQRI
jgi:hypothetical protein